MDGWRCTVAIAEAYGSWSWRWTKLSWGQVCVGGGWSVEAWWWTVRRVFLQRLSSWVGGDFSGKRVWEQKREKDLMLLKIIMGVGTEMSMLIVIPRWSEMLRLRLQSCSVVRLEEQMRSSVPQWVWLRKLRCCGKLRQCRRFRNSAAGFAVSAADMVNKWSPRRRWRLDGS